MFSFATLLGTPPELAHETYRILREDGDGVHVDAGLAVVTRYADVSRIHRDSTSTYSSDFYWGGPLSAHDPSDRRQVRFVEHMRHFILFLDPPSHTRLRGLARGAFTASAVGRMRESVVAATAEILSGLSTGQQIDFVADVAETLPVWVISDIMGFPREDRQHFRAWTLALAQTLDPAVQGDARAQALRSGAEMIDYLEDLVEHRRRHQGQDLISRLIAAESHDSALSSTELVCMVMVLLGAGNSTTTDLLCNGLKLLLDHPEQCALLRARPELAPLAVEEMLRLEPSLRWTGRRVTGECAVGRHRLGPGTLAWLGIAAANRDPRQFGDPETFDIRRADNQHLGFALGAHYCIGAPLARLEAAVFFAGALSRFPTIGEGSGAATYSEEFIARSMTKFPVSL